MVVARAIRRAAQWARFGLVLCQGVGTHWRRSDQSLASLPRRIAEQRRLLLGNGIGAEEYYDYGLHRPDLPWERKRTFIGSVEQWRWQSLFNPPAYRFFTEDKVVFKRYMHSAGIPVARLLGTLGPAGRAETGEPLQTERAVRAWFEAGKVEQVVVKPLLGSRGTGVLILGERIPGELQWRHVPSGSIDFAGVWGHLHGFPHRPDFLVEERLRPHPDLAAFSPEVVHSARVVTMLEDDVDVIAAAIRIGAGRSAVDNFSQGNLAAPIDLGTGRLGSAVFSRHKSLVRLDRHPATGAPIAGRILPDWEGTLAILRAAARAVPFNRLLGWDLAFSSRGPVVIEANDLWDPDVSQIAPDRGLLETTLLGHLERRDALGLIGLGWRPSRP